LDLRNAEHHCGNRALAADRGYVAGGNQRALLITTCLALVGLMRTLLQRAIRTAAAATGGGTLNIFGTNSGRASQTRHSACEQADNKRQVEEVPKAHHHAYTVGLRIPRVKKR
jgi:hypothetical protein